MKTLKKTLCLVLAVVMVVGVLILPASAADYTDDAEITHKEAVAVLTELNILTGNAGTYHPDEILERAQAASIISKLAQTPTVANRYPKGQTGFADVDSDKNVDWASGFIAFCASKKIISGNGTNYYPHEPLTGTAFAKMLLCTLGYDAETEGFTGNLWGINVISMAISVGLDEGIEDFDYDAPLSRDDAAQMTYNALTTPMVGYNNGVAVELTTGEGAAKTAVTLNSSKKYNVKVNDQLGADEYKRPESYSVKVGDKKVYNTFANAVGKEYKDAVTIKTILADLKITDGVHVKHYVDGAREMVAGGDYDDSNVAGTVQPTDTRTIGGSGKGSVTTIYKTTEKIGGEDTDVYLIITITAKVALVTKDNLKESGVLLLGEDGKDSAQYFTGEASVGDVIIYQSNGTKVTDAYVATHTTGKVTSKSEENGYVRIDRGSETYFAAKTVEGTVTAATADFTTTYDIYTDANGNIVYMKAVRGETKPVTEPTYVYVLRYQAKEGTPAEDDDNSTLIPTPGEEAVLPVIKAEVLDLATGNVTVYDVAYDLNDEAEEPQYEYLTADEELSGTKVTDETNGSHLGFKKITVLEDKTIVLEDAATVNIKPDVAIKDASASIGTEMYADGNTVLNLITPKTASGKTTYTVTPYTGYKSFKEIENDETLTNALVLFTQKDGQNTTTAKTIYLFGKVKDVTDPTAVTPNYYYIYVSKGEESETGITYKFLFNGKEVNYTTDKTVAAVKNGISATAGDILNLGFNDAGNITSYRKVDSANKRGSIASVSSDYIVIGSDVCYLTADVVIYDGRTSGDTAGTVVGADKLAAGLNVDLYYADSAEDSYSLIVIK